MTDAPHPDDLLASYVDGELDTPGRAVVDTHLAECPSCREEVTMAADARRALGDLPEAELPPATLQPVIREIDRATAAGRRRLRVADDPNAPTDSSGAWSASAPPIPKKDRRERMRALSGLAAAAVVVVLLVLAVPPLLNGGSDQAAQESAGAPGGAQDAGPEPNATSFPAPAVEQRDVDFNAGSVAALAADAARSSTESAGLQGGSEAPVPDEAAADSERAASVTACTDRWAAAAKGAARPLRLIVARYEGDPAYLGVYRIDATGAAPAKVAVWVLAPKGCELVTFSTKKI